MNITTYTHTHTHTHMQIHNDTARYTYHHMHTHTHTHRDKHSYSNVHGSPRGPNQTGLQTYTCTQKSCIFTQKRPIYTPHKQHGIYVYIHTQKPYTYCITYTPYSHKRALYSLKHTRNIHIKGPYMRGGGLGSRPKKMYWEYLGDGVEYHLMSPTPRR